jgi:hypothetical protein
MELNRKFEFSTSCRSVPLGSLEPDHPYPIVHAERINTRYRQSLLLGILVSPTTLWNCFYRDDIATCCRTKTCKLSIPNAWPYIWFTRARVRDQIPTSWYLRDNRPFILHIHYRYGRSESVAKIGSTGGPLTARTWRGLPYALVAVDCISIGRHRWWILHIEKDGSDMKFLIEK